MILHDNIYGNLNEVFSGIQGEGLLIGYRQVFIRMNGCNLDCKYCDTPAAKNINDTCRIEQTAGSRMFSYILNPVDYKLISSAVSTHYEENGLHHSVSITGGEPLCQPDFVANLASDLKSKGIKVMLETNGTLSSELMKVLPYLDMISMDIKLQSASGNNDTFSAHMLFLETAISIPLYVKVVVSSATSLDEIQNAAQLTANVDSKIPFVIQPVTSAMQDDFAKPDSILRWQAECCKYLTDVRVIPQSHKIIGQM
ncbi:MAG: 7-carboxy-7-deazaguanine synthase QueE [Armatimonadota bacterium]